MRTAIIAAVVACCCCLAVLSGCSRERTSPATAPKSPTAKRRVLVLGPPADAAAADAAAADPRLAQCAALDPQQFEWLSAVDPAVLCDRDLQGISAILLLRTPEQEFGAEARLALMRFVQCGGGVVAVHGALAADAAWPWYQRMMGGRAATLREPAPFVAGRADATEAWPERLAGDGALYQHAECSPRIEVLVEATVADTAHVPLAWRQSYDGGRSLCIAAPLDATALADPAWCALLRQALHWAGAGERQPRRFLPGDDYFEVETLVDGLRDPLEIALAPGGDVFVLEREGALKLYRARDRRIELVYRLGVACRDTDHDGVANECGGLGLALDPGFRDNGLLYLYYSPREPSVNRLSRFHFDGARLTDERMLFEVATDREHTTCHEGGSLAFGADGNLYLSTGDNTNPFESDGYAPIDEREGRREFDAQRSAGNSNDLRGSVLRIRPLPEGGYAIPPGNLWPAGTPDTRPEIYVKGCRNPYRIALDPLTNDVYWGDVGPDAGSDDDAGNPRGYDELNRARGAGFFGWPYYRGGRPYADRDFAAGTYGESFAVRLVNDSPNNTGLADLPPAQDPLIAYEYDTSAAFPELADGGRNAMAGPICYQSLVAPGLPPYFDRVLFFYDWSRAHVFAVALDEQYRFVTMHRFLGDQALLHPIDLEIDAAGDLYLLEYGSTWWDNADGRLRRIHFGGFNRRPRAAVAASVTSGAVPLTVDFTAAGSYDPEQRDAGDDAALSHAWDFGDGLRSDAADPQHVYRVPGIYSASLVVRDREGRAGTAAITVIAGNSAPAVELVVDDDDGVFEWGETLRYTVRVRDAEDGDRHAEVDVAQAAERIQVTAEYYPDGLPEEAPPADDPYLPGMNRRLLGTPLLREHGCVACHHPTRRSVGPSFGEIAAVAAAAQDADAMFARLTAQVKQGGAGRWGHVPMPAHAQVADAAIANMIDAILALDDADDEPIVGGDGRLVLPARPDDLREAFGSFVVCASYSDLGAPNLPVLTAVAEPVVLSAPPVVIEIAAQGTTPVPAIAAVVLGSGATRSEDHVSSYNDAATHLRWTIDVAAPGRYRVAIEQSVPESNAGSVYQLRLGDQTLQGLTVTTDGWESFVIVDLGELQIAQAGRQEIELVPGEILVDYLFNVKQLLLTAIDSEQATDR